MTEDRFWSDTWTSAERVLSQLADGLRRSRAVRAIEIDEGWSDDRDLSIPVGRWAWLDTRALVEDHGGGKAMLRVSTHLRPTTLGVVTALTLGLALPDQQVRAGDYSMEPRVVSREDPANVSVISAALWGTAQATAILGRSLACNDRPGHAADAVRTDARRCLHSLLRMPPAERHDLSR